MQDSLRARKWLVYFLKVLLTAGLYFVLARASLFFQFESSNATPVWPPAGFAFAAILIWGVRITPGILFGALVANFLGFIENRTADYPVAASLSFFIALGNTAEALTGNYIIRRLLPAYKPGTFPPTVPHILYFSLTAAIMCIVASTIGTTTVLSAGIIDSSRYPIVWLTWWLGDFSGILLFGSFLLIWINTTAQQIREIFSRIETYVFFAVVIFASGVIFDAWLGENVYFKWAYWIIPVLVWGALRFKKEELIAALMMCSLIAIWGTANNKGPFANITLNEALLVLQSFIAIMVITKLTLNASVSERKETELMLRKTGSELDMRVKKRTAQLEERNKFVETILNSSFDSIIVIDKDMKCISINRIAKNHLRLPFPENVIGKKITELPSFVLPDMVMDDLNSAFRGETIHQEKFPSPISEKYFEIDYIPLRNSTKVDAVMIVAHDITQRIHAEQEIREQKAFAEMLIESSPYMILAYDRHFTVTAWNKKSEEHTGIKREEVIGRHIYEVFPKYHTEQWMKMAQQVFEEGRSFHFPKIPFQYHDGWGESFVSPLYNSNDEVIGLLSITLDITDVVNITSALEQRNKDLQKTNEELSSFAYVASHDLQEPLRKIQIFSKLIVETEKENLSDTGKNYFDRMRSAAERMQNLIEDLLTYSRTASQASNLEDIHLGAIVEEVKESLKDEIAQKNATIIANDLCVCRVVHFQFRQILHNLITNSLKFASKDRDPVITISSKIVRESRTAGTDSQNSHCHITVEDNGIGFDPKFNEQIFGLFQRLHGKKEYPGTGIGLAICKKIVENHDGVIKAHGQPGKGARFDIYIPVSS